MNESTFWELCEKHLARGRGDDEERVERLVAALEKLPPKEIAAFQRLFDQAMDRAYRWDLWGAAYVILGGCSDDGFEYFRAWLISRGRSVYEAALAEPESLAVEIQDDPDWAPDLESLLYAAAEAYESATGGDELPESDDAGPAEPVGVMFDENRVAEAYPRISARLEELGR